MFPNTYFPSGSGTLFFDGSLLKYRHPDGKVLTLVTVTDPAQVPGLQLWLRADSLANLADGAAVTSWADSSGRGRGASQDLAARQPIFRAGARNGLPAVRFDGVDDCLDGAAANWRTLFAVVRTDASPTIHMALWGQSTPTTDISVRRYAYGPNYSHNNANDFAPAAGYRINGVATNQVANNIWHIVTAESPALQAFAYRVGGTGNFTPGRCWDGDVAELIVYDGPLSAADRAGLENYLSFKYAIPLGV